MNRSVNIFCAIALSVALLYSGMAWAFLKCSHEWESFSDRGMSEAPSSEASDAADVPEIECLHPDYQLGPVAVDSFSPRKSGSMDGVRFDIISQAPVVEGLQIVWAIGFLERFALFDKLSLNLFLSIFRI